MRRAAWVAALILLGVAAGLLAFALGRGDSEPPRAATRSAGSTFCPKVSLVPRAGLEFFDHQLRNLGDGLMGESRFYRDDGATFEIHVGFEALEAFEDLDFVSRGTLVLAGREFKLSRAAAINSQFWAATVDLGLGLDGCREVTVIGRGLTERRFRALLALLRFPAR